MNQASLDTVGERPWFRRIGCVVTVVAAIGVCTYIAQAIMGAREAARTSQCLSRMSQLHLALHSYHDMYGSFPPAYIADEDGTPMHSWRVLMLPFMDQVRTYEQYRFDESWNSPHNQSLADDLSPEIFSCPSAIQADRPHIANYLVVVGPDTAFPGADCTRLDDFKNRDAILLVESANSDIHWMEPRDLRVDEMSFTVNDTEQPSISSPHRPGALVLRAGPEKSRFIDAEVDPQTLRAMTRITDDAPVFLDRD